MFHNAASNIICRVLFGTRYDYDDSSIKEVVECFKENSKIANGPWAMVGHNISSDTSDHFVAESRSEMEVFDKVFASSCTTPFP